MHNLLKIVNIYSNIACYYAGFSKTKIHFHNIKVNLSSAVLAHQITNRLKRNFTWEHSKNRLVLFHSLSYLHDWTSTSVSSCLALGKVWGQCGVPSLDAAIWQCRLYRVGHCGAFQQGARGFTTVAWCISDPMFWLNCYLGAIENIGLI